MVVVTEHSEQQRTSIFNSVVFYSTPILDFVFVVLLSFRLRFTYEASCSRNGDCGIEFPVPDS